MADSANSQRLVSVHDRARIEALLRRNTELHLYALGDLDPFFWPYTVWYGLERGDELQSVVLLYLATAPPTLLALPYAPDDGTRALLSLATPLLPPRFYGHLDPSFVELLAPFYRPDTHGRHLKMALRDRRMLERVDTTGVIGLGPSDVDELRGLYAAAYPGNWFDARMLETGQYYGLRRDGQLVGVAGVHVYSPRYRAAALGNVATHPLYRGQGVARAVTARLCRALLANVDHIGLNVKADNSAAIAAYRRLGFEPIAEYEECELTIRNTRSCRRL